MRDIPEPVDDARHQGRLGPDDGQVHAAFTSHGEEPVDVLRVDGDVLTARLGRRAGIARCHQHPTHASGLRAFPGQRMLAAPTSYNENDHRITWWLAVGSSIGYHTRPRRCPGRELPWPAAALNAGSGACP